MEKSNTTIDIEKFPYLKIQQKSISEYKKLIDLLNKRKELSKDQWDNLTPYEKNEREILLLKTDRDLASTHTKIIQMEDQLNDFMEALPKNIEEMESKWDMIMNIAAKKAERDKAFAKTVESLKNDFPESEFETNYEYKLNFYNQIKRLVNPSKSVMRKL